MLNMKYLLRSQLRVIIADKLLLQLYETIIKKIMLQSRPCLTSH